MVGPKVKNMEEIEWIKHSDENLALIIRGSYSNEGIKFFTPNTYSQQIGYMRRPSGYVIDPHVHNPVLREVYYTNEVLIIRSGRVIVDFYCNNKNYLESRELIKGDIILLISGGHGFKILEDSEIFEIKQGPYAGEQDKTRFKSDIQS
jgi:mannose-6-phosphate isomerase-like protein (cupin superfamily)